MSKNKYTFLSVIIPLNKRHFTRIDLVDADLASLKWYPQINKTNIYVMGVTNRSTVFLHRVILSRVLNRPLLSREHVDHKNNNSLDNRRSNLRLATPLQNAQNARIRKDNTSGYKGVFWDKHAQKWRARIRVNKRYKYLGCFDTPEDAYKAYCQASRIYHGEFSRLA